MKTPPNSYDLRINANREAGRKELMKEVAAMHEVIQQLTGTTPLPEDPDAPLIKTVIKPDTALVELTNPLPVKSLEEKYPTLYAILTKYPPSSMEAAFNENALVKGFSTNVREAGMSGGIQIDVEADTNKGVANLYLSRHGIGGRQNELSIGHRHENEQQRHFSSENPEVYNEIKQAVSELRALIAETVEKR